MIQHRIPTLTTLIVTLCKLKERSSKYYRRKKKHEHLLSKENCSINGTLCIYWSTANIMLKLKRNSAENNNENNECPHVWEELIRGRIKTKHREPYVWSGDVKWYKWNAWPDRCSSGTPTISSCCSGSRIIWIWLKNIQKVWGRSQKDRNKGHCIG